MSRRKRRPSATGCPSQRAVERAQAVRVAEEEGVAVGRARPCDDAVDAGADLVAASRRRGVGCVQTVHPGTVSRIVAVVTPS